MGKFHKLTNKGKRSREEFVEEIFNGEINQEVIKHPTTLRTIQEALNSYINGLYISTIVLSQIVMEHVIREKLGIVGRISYKALLGEALNNGIISPDDYKKLFDLSEIRNPVVHGIENPDEVKIFLTEYAAKDSLSAVSNILFF